jgi:hypothetical protein
VPDIAVQHFLELGEHHPGHVLDPADQLLRMEIAADRRHPLADVLGQIADALEVVGDAQRTHHLAQVDRHRLPARDRQHRLFLDLALQRVDRRIERNRALGPLGIAPGQRLDCIGNLLLSQTAHFRDHAGDVLQIDIEGLGSVLAHCDCHWRHSLVDQPNRPVT